MNSDRKARSRLRLPRTDPPSPKPQEKIISKFLAGLALFCVAMMAAISAYATPTDEQALCMDNKSGGLIILTFRLPTVTDDGSVAYLALTGDDKAENIIKGMWVVLNNNLIGIYWFASDLGDVAKFYKIKDFRPCVR